ncbi:hypothetical protein BH09SUM1_BH09SUM1_25380 [soil metagenome]
MRTTEYFNYKIPAAKAGITDAQLEELYQRTLKEYHGDMMMAELRVLRSCSAAAKGYCTVEEALAPDVEPVPRFNLRVAEDQAPYGENL